MNISEREAETKKRPVTARTKKTLWNSSSALRGLRPSWARAWPRALLRNWSWRKVSSTKTKRKITKTVRMFTKRLWMRRLFSWVKL